MADVTRDIANILERMGRDFHKTTLELHIVNERLLQATEIMSRLEKLLSQKDTRSEPFSGVESDSGHISPTEPD